MKVFLTGGTGLVGSHVIDLLSRSGHTVRALVRSTDGQNLVESLGAEAAFGSVEETAGWKHAEGMDAIVHSAAIITARKGWDAFKSTNVDGARNAVATAAELGIRLVHVSSVAVYGRAARSGSFEVDENTEWTELKTTEFYARSKRQAEEAVSGVARDSKLSAISLRPCVIYGERDRTFLPHVVRIMKHGYAPVIGTGTNTLSVVYAGNVADAVLAALNRTDVTGPVNVTNDGGITQRQFFTAVGAALGREIRLVRVPVLGAFAFTAIRNGLRKVISPTKNPGFGASAVRFLARDNPYTSEKALAEMGWRPSTPPIEAIQRSVRWFTHA